MLFAPVLMTKNSFNQVFVLETWVSIRENAEYDE